MKARNHEDGNVNRCYLYLDLSGKRFSPSAAEIKLGIVLQEKIEPGALRVRRIKNSPPHGKPSPVGSAILQAPEFVCEFGQREWLVDAVRRLAGKLRRLGADNITFWQVEYRLPDAQKNFELSVATLAVLAGAKVYYCLSIYDMPRKQIDRMPMRYAQGFVPITIKS